jgi:molybdate transport system substrate-binding protein
VRLVRAFVATVVAAASCAARPLSVAAAANLTHVIGALNAEYQKENPGIEVTTALGASGSLVAQIANGAPYDIFLSADMGFPAALAKAGHADAASLSAFAVGRLVLWTMKAGIDVPDVASVVRNPSVHSLAIANTEGAPYGRAARQALEKLGVWVEAQPKLVVGEDISQTAQFVQTGSADAGFVALSTILSPKLKGHEGRWIEVPAELYKPVVQGAIITTHGRDNPAAASYVAFLGSPAACLLLKEAGYGIPAVPFEAGQGAGAGARLQRPTFRPSSFW